MDKETLSNYGWIVICILVLSVMIALATPFGTYISNAVKSTTEGLFKVQQNALGAAGLDISDQEFCKHTETEIRNTTTNYTGDTCCKLCNKILSKGAYTIPAGGTYYVGVTSITTGEYTGATETYIAGQAMPITVNDGDVYVFGDYEYRYNQKWTSGDNWRTDTSQNGWGVRVLDTTKTTYGEILESINSKPITSLYTTYYRCESLTTAPAIPSSVTNMCGTFQNCSSLITYVGSTDADGDFSGYVIPSSVTNIGAVFMNCKSLVTAPAIPSNVTTMEYTFSGCTSLVTAPVIPSGVTNMGSALRSCSSLKTYAGSTDIDGDFSNYVIPNGVTNMRYTFYECKQLTITPAIPSSVTNMYGTFVNCTSLVDASNIIIPHGVTDISETFANCKSLTGTIEINVTNIASYKNCFYNVNMTNITLTGSASKDVLNLIGATGKNWTPIE